MIDYTVEALVSDHLGNSEKWSQLAIGPSRFRELTPVSDHVMKQYKVVPFESFFYKAWEMFMVTNSVVAIILNSLLLILVICIVSDAKT